MKLIIGLGNPGPEYEQTRHNIGFRVLDQLREDLNFPDWSESKKFNALIAKGNEGAETTILLKPQTYMNLSGGSISKVLQFFRINPEEDILVVHDDKDLLFGKLREKAESGSGGHNGIKSVIAVLGSEKFYRLKIGVGHEEQKIPTHDFVLQRFSEEEESTMDQVIQQSIKYIKDWLEQA